MVAKSYTFQESVDYLLSLGNEVSAMKLGLENIRRLLLELGDPQTAYLKVQVAGTNGKGSVCAFLDSICREAGVRAGLYTSPHLISITERIKIAGVDISEVDFARLASRVRNTAEDHVGLGSLEYTPTYFEQVTAIGLLAFAEAKVELAILETGLGGRLDATTAAHAEIAAITRIDYDHQQYLGETIEEIASEKAAIITADTREVILGEQSRDIMRFLRKHCSDLGIEPINDEYDPWRLLAGEDGTVKVGLSLIRFPPIRLGLKGHHQIENAQTAIQIAKALLHHRAFSWVDDIEVKVVEGLKNARHPGRLDWREYRGNRILLDGAHNAGGARALADYLKTDQSDARITLVFGLMDDKDVDAFTSVLFSLMENIVFTRPNNPRAADPALPAERARATIDPAKIFVVPDVAEALDAATKITAGYGATRPAFTCVAGSLYLVGEALALIEAMQR